MTELYEILVQLSDPLFVKAKNIILYNHVKTALKNTHF